MAETQAESIVFRSYCEKHLPIGQIVVHGPYVHRYVRVSQQVSTGLTTRLGYNVAPILW